MEDFNSEPNKLLPLTRSLASRRAGTSNIKLLKRPKESGYEELDGARAPNLLCSGATERPAAKRGTPDGDAGYSIDL